MLLITLGLDCGDKFPARVEEAAWQREKHMEASTQPLQPSLSLPQRVHFLRCVPPTLDARQLGPPLQPVCINSAGLPGVGGVLALVSAQSWQQLQSWVLPRKRGQTHGTSKPPLEAIPADWALLFYPPRLLPVLVSDSLQDSVGTEIGNGTGSQKMVASLLLNLWS